MAATITYGVVAPAKDVSSNAAALQPSPAWHGLRVGLERGVQIAVAVIGGLGMVEFRTGLGWLADFATGFLLIGFLYSGLNALVTLLWKLLGVLAKGIGTLGARRLSPERAAKALAPYRFARRIRGQSLGAILAPIAIMFMELAKIDGPSIMSLPAVTESLIPFAIVSCALTGVATVRSNKPWLRIAIAAAAVAVIAAPVAWYLWPGTTDHLVQPNREALDALPRFSFENPGLPGQYGVQTLTYGSGEARRPEFGRDAALITPTVDPTAAYSGWNGMAAGFYQWLFGFDFKHLPLAGRVWYPNGSGPFPLVLIVHGNHGASDYSDPGYAYLGQHFASRGFITVSVDENFLNGHALWDGKGAEMPVRAWMLLKHLQVWREWSRTPGHPFYGRVDLDRVVLVGHSRGGEAVAHAAMLNSKLNAPVSRLSKDGDFGFGIRGVVAIAPSDGQWKAMGTDRKIVDVSYLLIQGGHDQDLSSLAGIRQYNRVAFEANADAFKAVVYIYRANHGNFSTVWGSSDHGTSASMILNRAALLDGEDQRMATKVFLASFLEATLNDRPEYRKVFVTPAGARDWLPYDIYITEYQDATFKAVKTHESRGKAESADMVEAKARFSGLLQPSRTALMLRDGQSQQNSAFVAQWEADANPTYTLTLPQGAHANFSLEGDERLAFALANATDERTVVYVSVELVDAQGSVAIRPANRYGIVPPTTPARLEKSKQMSRALGCDFFPKLKSPYEHVLQSFEIPLAAFTTANPDFDPTQLTTIRFRFYDEQPGKVYLDEIGFRG